MTTNVTVGTAFTAILGTISTTAQVGSNLIDTVGDGVSMLNKTVKAQSLNQSKRIMAANAIFERELAIRTTKRSAELTKEVTDFLTENSELTEQFNSEYNALMEAFKTAK